MTGLQTKGIHANKITATAAGAAVVVVDPPVRKERGSVIIRHHHCDDEDEEDDDDDEGEGMKSQRADLENLVQDSLITPLPTRALGRRL
jgi:uncharacterized metal-binding protein YceD (DUF177 family)